MATSRIKQPTLYLRTAYFIDLLRVKTGQGLLRLERRIRENQYEAYGLQAPDLETIRGYFLLHRSVAFEPRNSEPNSSEMKAPWLLAAELEVPGSSFAFFHPLFDILFGRLESSVFWSAHFSKIPQAWIDYEERKGNPSIAEEWRVMNQSLARRLHRTRQVDNLDTLSFLHLTLLRFPAHISSVLFERNGLSPTWTRRYQPPEEEVGLLQKLKGLDALAALLALTKEGAEIGDVRRFQIAKAAALQYLKIIDSDPACKRIYRQVRTHVSTDLENYTDVRRYSRTLHYGFGLPASWRALLTSPLIERSREELGLNAPSASASMS